MTFSTPAMKKEGISRYKETLSFFVAAIFLTHPLQTGAVTYIFQRATIQAALFYLLSLSLYIKSILDLEKNGRINRLCYAGSFVAAFIGMFSKENTGTIPFMILLYDFCFLRKGKNIHWKHVLPFFLLLPVITLTISLSKSIVSRDVARLFADPLQNSTHYMLTQFRVAVTYLRLFVVPINQNLIYDYPVAKSLFELPTLTSLIFLGSIFTIAIRLFSRHRLISFSIFWFFLTLLPESSVVPLRDVIFEHRLYLPMIGFSLFLVSLIYKLVKSDRITAMVIALLIITSCFALLTYRRNFIWKDEVTLWNDVVHKSPNKAVAYNNRGDAYREKGDIQRALADFNKAIEIDPGYADSYNNRGNLYKQQGRIELALADYNKLIGLDPNPADAYNNRANIYKLQGNIQKALADYNKAIEYDPRLEGVYLNRGNIHKALGNIERALADYNKAIEINPNRASVFNNRGNIYRNQGDVRKALADYNKAIEINPDYPYAYYNRGYIYKEQGNMQKALADYNKAVEIKPDLIGVYLRRGNAYRKQGNIEQALADYNKAVEIDPNRASIYNNRGNAYRKQGNIEQALADYNKAVEIDPDYADTYNNRAVVYYQLKEYDRAWADVHKAEILGYKANTEDLAFLRKLKNDSGRDR